jgi:hypothetical protein
MDTNLSPTPESPIDEPERMPRWAALVIPLAAAMVLATTLFIWMEVLVRS